MFHLIKQKINDYRINISDEKIKKLSIYIKELIDKNKKINLVSRKDEKNIITRHLIDSLIITKTGLIDSKIKKLADIGSGGGFPAIPMAVVYNNIELTLIEKVTKKAMFLIYIKHLLGLKNTTILNKEIKKGEEDFDAVTQRAAGNFKVVYDIAKSLLKNNGIFITWTTTTELENINKDINFIYNYNLDDGIKRAIASLKKGG